ncbi:11542_t:CDS:2 [Funneliformis geosporum]|nr:11542_t:CDS:2 [Funneliformis geosporum]
MRFSSNIDEDNENENMPKKLKAINTKPNFEKHFKTAAMVFLITDLWSSRAKHKYIDIIAA